jgi:hypothetical protein
MFQPIRIIARALLIPATAAAIALTSQPTAPAGALPATHFRTAGSSTIAASTPTSLQKHVFYRWA